MELWQGSHIASIVAIFRVVHDVMVSHVAFEILLASDN